MAKASIQQIYDRMNSVENYHPFTADTYADWSLEAGDIVTVSRDGKSLTGPVHNATVRWTGKQKVSLESRGEKERGSIAKMSARAFNSGGNGGGAYRSGYGGRKLTDKQLAGIEEYVDRVKIYAETEAGDLKSSINVQAGRIDIVVEGSGPNAHVKPAVITAAITDDNGYLSSNIKISADKIMLDGSTSIGGVMEVGNGTSVWIKKPLYVTSGGRNVLIQGGYIRAYHYYVDVTRELEVANVTVSGNDLVITHSDGSKENFSKATTLRGAWNSSRKLTVNAYQANSGRETQVGNPFETTVVGSIAAADFTSWDDYWGTAKLHAIVGSSETPVTIGNVLVNAKAAYDAGKASVPSYSHSAVLTYVRFDDDYEEHIYRSEDLITRQSAGATKTVHYN